MNYEYYGVYNFMGSLAIFDHENYSVFQQMPRSDLMDFYKFEKHSPNVFLFLLKHSHLNKVDWRGIKIPNIYSETQGV